MRETQAYAHGDTLDFIARDVTRRFTAAYVFVGKLYTRNQHSDMIWMLHTCIYKRHGYVVCETNISYCFCIGQIPFHLAFPKLHIYYEFLPAT